MMFFKNSKSLLLLLALSFTVVCLSGCQWSPQRQNAAGRQAFLNGQFSQAINHFQQALSRNPGDADALYNMGVSYFTLGKQAGNNQWLGQGEQFLRQAIAQNDQHVDAHRSLAVLLADSGRQNHAFDLLSTWRDRHPQSGEPLIELARMYQEIGDTNQATNLLANALQLDGGNVRALKAMGHVRELQGQYNLALDNYLRSYQLDGRQADVASKIGEIQVRIAQATSAGGGPQSVLSR